MVMPIVVGGTLVDLTGKLIQGKAQLDQARAQNRLDQQTYAQLSDIYARLQEQYKALEEGYQLPPGTVAPVSMEELQLVGQFQPEIPSLVQETAPQLITESASGAEIAAQRDALSQYQNMAQTGDDAISRAARERAGFEADQRMKSLRAGVLRDRAARGMLGSGDELLASLQGADSAAIAAREGSLNAAEQAQQRRIQALAASANLAGNIRQQNTGTERANTEIMNAFNQRMAANQNVYNQQSAGIRNQAQMTNLQAQQRVADANVDIRNKQTIYNTESQRAAEQARRNAQNQLLDVKTQNAQSIAQQEAGLLDKQSQIQANKLATTYLPRHQAGNMISSTGEGATNIGLSQLNQPKKVY
jgi:hypothetical protein